MLRPITPSLVLAAVATLGGGAADVAHATLIATINPFTGGVTLTADTALTLTGYQVDAPAGGFWDFGDAAWNSLSDQGFAGWVQLSGAISDSPLLAEGNFASGLALAAGESVSLGTPYVGPFGVAADGFALSFGTPAGGESEDGSVVVVPEPAGLTLLVVGALLIRRRPSRA